MNQYSKYVSYFKGIAINHVDILHDDSNNVRFFRMNVEELATGFRTKIGEKGIILVLINYAYGVKDDKAHDLMKAVNWGFLVLKHHKFGDHNEFQKAYEDCEKIVDNILVRIKHESKTNSPTADNFYNSQSNLSNIHVSPVDCQGDINYSGFMVTGEMHVPLICTVDHNKWSDLTEIEINNAGNWGE